MDPSALRSHGQGLPEESSPEGNSPEQALPRRLAGSRDSSAHDRRRNLRQKLHSPVYVSFDGPASGFAVDLSELLDLHEDGFAVQTAEPLEVNRTVTLCLDLPETQSYIHSSGEVIWSDQAGRGGIRFRALSDDSRQVLRQWLFANLLIASNNRASQSERRDQEERIIHPVPVTESVPEIIAKCTSVLAMPPRSEAFSIESVRHEIRELDDDVDTVLQVLTERAQNLTGASGAALAFLTRPTTGPSTRPSNDEQMLCRARCGDPAPPLGSPVEIKHGLSGECVRTGQIVSCDDMANTKDPRIDPEVGRALGIGSLIAVPIVSDFRVVGLLEVFSPHPHAFTEAHATILERLVEMIPNTYRQTTDPETTQLENAQREECRREERRISPLTAGQAAPLPSMPRSNPRPTPLSQPVLDDRAETRDASPRLVYRVLLGLVTIVVATVLGYLVGPIVGKHWFLSPQASQQTSAEVVEAASTASGQRPQATTLAGLRQLADQGDADAEWQMGIRCHDSYPPDDAQAIKWFERAADQGYVAAQATLGAYYWAGRGVPSDLSKAYMWSAIAFAGGDQNSKIRVEGLASQMTRAQVSAARQQAEVWIRQHNAAKSESN
jgi:GAF domain/PilZ domain/Sel1 repeat